jgi:hypothetical protein
MNYALLITSKDCHYDSTHWFHELIEGFYFFPVEDLHQMSIDGFDYEGYDLCRDTVRNHQFDGVFVVYEDVIDEYVLTHIFNHLYELAYLLHDMATLYVPTLDAIPNCVADTFLKLAAQHLVHVEFVLENYYFHPIETHKATPVHYRNTVEEDQSLIREYDERIYTELMPF